jgi:transcriptional regulator with XRE-family HTH domain
MTIRKFRELRQDIGYSQAKLAKEMGVTIRTVSRWEHGDFPIPKVAELALKTIVREAGEKRSE